MDELNPFVRQETRQNIVFRSEYLPVGTTKDLVPSPSIAQERTRDEEKLNTGKSEQGMSTLSEEAIAQEEDWTERSTSVQEHPKADVALPKEHMLLGPVLLLRRFGPIEFGMTVSEAETALRESCPGDKYAFDDPGCYYVAPESIPQGIGFMVEDEKIVRVDIEIAEVATKSGVHVGSTLRKLLETYPGRLQSAENRYDPLITEYIYVPQDRADKDFRMLFMVKDGKVIHMRAGILPAVLYCERCL